MKYKNSHTGYTFSICLEPQEAECLAIFFIILTNLLKKNFSPMYFVVSIISTKLNYSVNFHKQFSFQYSLFFIILSAKMPKVTN